MINGKAKAPIVSAAVAVLLCLGTFVGWLGGWKANVGAKAIRDEKVSKIVESAEATETKVNELGQKADANAVNITNLAGRVDNLDWNVRTLVQSQEQTNIELRHLSAILIDQATKNRKSADRRPQ